MYASFFCEIAGVKKDMACILSGSPNLKLKKMNNLQDIVDKITANTIFCSKEVLTSEEVARYMGISKSYLYKLTMSQKIPHYKPMGKMCFFNRLEIEQWLQSNRVSTEEEISSKAQSYIMKGGNV